MDEHAQPNTTTDTAHGETHDNRPPRAKEMEDVLPLIFDEPRPAAAQGQPRDELFRDDESFNALVTFYQDGVPAVGPMPAPAPGRATPHGELAIPAQDPASASSQAHLRGNYAALGPMSANRAATAGNDHAGKQPAETMGQRLRILGAPALGADAPAATNSTSGPADWQEDLDYAQSEEDAHHPSAEVERAAALDLDLLLPGTSDTEQLTLSVRTRWLLEDIKHIMNGTHTMADIIFDHRGGRHSRPPTMEHSSQWRYVATRLMAHMGAYTPNDLDGLHWRWHHRAALRIREALIRHHIWTIWTPHPRGQAAPGRTTGHQRQRSPTTQGHRRQVSRTSPSQGLQGLPSAMGPPYSPQRSPLRPFAHQGPDHGREHTPRMETRRPPPLDAGTTGGTRGTTGAQSHIRTLPPAL